MWACDPVLTTNIANSYQMAGPTFVQALTSFFAAQCAIYGDHLWPEDSIQKVLEDPNYDFVIIGAGSAGSVVANRLSEIPDWKVLLVEAGGNPTLSTETPQLFYSNMGTTEDWNYKTEPEEKACRAYKSKGCAWPRGKVLGGSSSTNAMFYVRGNKLDYDDWAAAGNIGWSYDEVLPYFKKSENFLSEWKENFNKHHGKNGYLNVLKNSNMHEFENLIIQAGMELGFKNNSDYNAEDQMGIMNAYKTISDGKRFSTARAFLKPIKNRSNLHVIKNSLAKKILFEPGTRKVKSIQIKKDGKDILVNIGKELILSAGTINSPQLLLLSGIGPKEHLEKMDIDLIADLPVGEHLQDHVFVPVIFTAAAPDNSAISIENIFKSLVSFTLHGNGSLSEVSPHGVVAFVNTTDSYATSPDIQYHFLFFPPNICLLLNIFEKHDLSDEVITKYKKMSEHNFTLMIYNTLLKPKSFGKIVLRSKNANDPPLIYANYFDSKKDLDTLITSFNKYLVKFGETKSLKEAGFELNWIDLEECKNIDKNSNEFLECYSKQMTFSLYHPTSTCKMGPENDKNSVVDNELRVHHVQGLRVIDSSIMPSIVRGNTNAPTIMIGEKGSDMIKQFWLKNNHE